MSTGQPTPPDLDPSRLAALRARVDDLMPQVLSDLTDLARIPSVSLPSFDAAHVAASADRVAELLRGAGAQVEVVRAGDGHPAVIGRVPGPPGAPTVLLYAHHDVQPPGAESDWDTPPFEPTPRGDRLFGRGVADDKAGILAHVAALRVFDGQPPVNVVVFVEGEEEAGSESLPALLAEHHEALACDALVIADSGNWDIGTPALTTTLRGNLRVVVELRTLRHGVHSGMFGGLVPDAITAMCRLLATLHHDDGSLALTGLIERDDAQVDYPPERMRAESGALDGVEFLGEGTLASRLWTKPALTVIGIDAPSVDEAANLLTPVCRAKLSMRIAPEEDPQHAVEVLTEHLRAHAPWGAHVEVTPTDSGRGFTTTTDGPYVDAARAAFADAWQTEPVEAGIGGSIPFIAEFAEAFPQASILVTGVEDPDTRAHGANESLHVPEFARVCLAEAVLLERLGALRT
ncbi:dipeptidase [Piscicoccus intestinalis]|uniref:dipeptidase n=1 Tax=Piscicoccus intestinalis TaxID=746033 RepID=UPI000837E2E5|nr:dipeptidase [Piscicoccus intestinalis]